MTAKRYRLPDVLGGGEIEAGEVAIGKAWRYDFVGGCLWPDERLTEINPPTPQPAPGVYQVLDCKGNPRVVAWVDASGGWLPANLTLECNDERVRANTNEATAHALAAENARLRQELNASETKGARVALRLRAAVRVVEAAEAWTALGVGITTRSQLNKTLMDAVDAYRAGQNTPPSPPESTLSQDPAEVAVASTDTPEAQRGPQGAECCHDWIRDTVEGAPVTVCTRCGLSPDEDHPSGTLSDPPGLDAAIEAAAIGYDEAVNTALGNPPGSVFGEVGRSLWAEHPAFIAAVRAAAPALRAGALREAADEWSIGWINDGTGFPERTDDWLRERADRIGGAT